jgi:hypothetical protein
MADAIETIYEEFTAAMQGLDSAMQVLDNATIEFKAARKKFQTAYDNYVQLMSEYNADMTGSQGGTDSWLGLMGQFTGGKNLNSLFDNFKLF